MYAVIDFAGHQYKVKEGDRFKVNSLSEKEGTKVKVDEVLMTFDEAGKASVGTPTVSGASVELKVVSEFKDKKVRVFKMKPKKRYMRNKGHRQEVTLVEVVKISVGGSSSSKSAASKDDSTEKPKAEKKPAAKKAAPKKTTKKAADKE